MKRRTALAVTSTLLVPFLLVTACGTPPLAGKLSAPNGNTAGAAMAQPSANATAATGGITPTDSNIGSKGVNSHISAKQQTQAQAAVNQLVATINQLH